LDKRLSTQRPEKIGKYEILEVLGRGGMGVVYHARDARLGREVAIKMLTEGYRGNSEMLQRFYREASRTSALRHNNIVIVYDAGDQDGEPYLVMEYVDGEPLDKAVRQRLELQTSLSIVEQICLALAYAHRNGLVHRDIKPANVILRSDGVVKLLDFGIARDQTKIDTSLTSTGALVGTPPYMAPERFRGAPIDGRSDIFSTGVLLYLLLTGRLPFDADYPAIIEQILTFEPPLPSQVINDCPASVDAIVAKALAKSPQERYANADDMAMDLHEVGEGLTRARISELMTEGERRFADREFIASQGALKQILRLDSQHIAAKRLLSAVEQRITQQEKERKAQEVVRSAKQASTDREWDRALVLCDEAMRLNPADTALAALRKSILDGKQTQEKVSQLLAESSSARKMGELTRAQMHAASAQRLDPNNSQVLAQCKLLEQEIEEKRVKEELRGLLATARQHLAANELAEALAVLDKGAALAPGNVEIMPLRDQLNGALKEEKRKTVLQRLEEKAALSTTLEKLRLVSGELVEAQKEFPNDPSLLRLRMGLDPRIKQLEDEFFVRDTCKRSAEMPPNQALALIRQALLRLPGNEQLAALEIALSERFARQARDQLLTQHLSEARQAIDDRLFLEATKILERCKGEGYASYEVDGLLEIAKKAASERLSHELLDRTHSQAKRAIEQGEYQNAIQLLRRALRQVDEPVLHRLLNEATEKLRSFEQRADSALERAGELQRAELFAEAVLLLEDQQLGVKRLARIEQALRQARTLQQAEADFHALTGRCYAQLGNVEGIDDLKRALNTVVLADSECSHEVMKKELRRRCEQVFGEKASWAIGSVRELLSRDEYPAAEAILKETMPWRELTSAQAQEDMRALELDVAAAKKVLRFRKGGWR
jgi:eukaryotic-like serine/threonine-protein kinase